ncbi:hypothetical protein MAR_021185 [Mya arenaria]|uniref:Uncharacterized protein n=1 Tax=Mya arenaria TaxID=6604 RepID=A0ABY7EF77_MYAAR|nr:hypothetical protein MAR_021185 [Mya arenaria]
MWIKRKDKERKKNKQKKTETLPSEKEMNQGFKSKKTLYSLTSFARKSIPQSPQKFAQVIKSLVNNTTPRKKEAAQRALEKKYQMEMKECSTEKHTTNEIQEHTEELKEESSGNTTKQHKKNNVCPIFDRKPCVIEDIATPLPQKRYASKHGPGYVMQVTLLVAFTLFKKENPDCRIGLTIFTALRPKNVRLLTTRHWNYCVCLICQNVLYKLKTLNRFLPEKIKDFNQLLDVILCPKSDAQRFHSGNCLFRSCDKFKDTKSKLLSFFDSTNQKVDNSLVTSNHWEKVVEDGKPRKVLRAKRESFTDMFEELLTDTVQPVQGSSFAEHLFVGNWQQHQFSELKKNLPNDSKSLEYLNDIGIKFSKLYVFSDGCDGQYKGKGSFADLSLKSIHVDRSYFGSDHGKSECDGELGSINRVVDLALVGRKVVIKNAEDMSSWCSTIHQLPKTRSTLQPTSEVLPNTSSTIQLNEKGLARQEESGDQHAGKSTEKQTIQTKPTMSSCEKKSSKQDPKLVKTQIEGTLYEKVVGCSTYEALQHSVIQMEIPPLPHLLDVTFASHKRTIDDTALPLLPENMKDLGLFPSTVYGDGNCQP